MSSRDVAGVMHWIRRPGIIRRGSWLPPQLRVGGMPGFLREGAADEEGVIMPEWATILSQWSGSDTAIFTGSVFGAQEGPSRTPPSAGRNEDPEALRGKEAGDLRWFL